jgi:hypothetical protein
MEFANFPYLSAILLSCVVGLLVILFIPAERKMLIKWVSLVFAGITMVLSIYLFFAYDKAQGGLQFVEKVLWVESMGIYYFNAADGFNLPMLMLTGIVLFTGVLTMWELEVRVKEFFAFTFLLVAGVFGVFMSMDLFFIFVWYDVSLFPMYPLIAIWGSTRKEYGAMKLTLYLLAGSALILPGILYLFVKSGLNTFDVVALMQPGVHVVAGGTCGRAHCGEHDSRGRAHEARRFRGFARSHISLSRRLAVLGPTHGGTGDVRHCLWRLCGFGPNGSKVCDWLLQCLPYGHCRSWSSHCYRRWA